MRFRDKIKLAIKNIKEEGKKSILTVFNVFFLSLLLTTMLIVGTSFQKSIENSYQQIIPDNVANIQCNDTDSMIRKKFQEIQKIVKSCPYVVSFQLKWYDLAFEDFSYLSIKDVDNNQIRLDLSLPRNCIFLNSSFYGEYDKNDTYIYHNVPFIVAGFFSDDSSSAYANINYAVEETAIDLSSFFIRIEKSSSANMNGLLKSALKLKDDLSTIEKGVYSEELSTLKQLKSVSSLVVWLIVFMTFIFLLITIGTISNSILISMDKKSYLTGLYKALGMKNKDIFSITLLETILTIGFAHILSTLVIFFSKSIILRMTKQLYDFLVYLALDKEIAELSVTFSFPFYIPIVMTTLFVFFSLFFARKTIEKNVTASPVTIMNEVTKHE